MSPPQKSSLIGLGRRVVRRLPVVGSSIDASIDVTERELARAEKVVWSQVRRRLDEAAPSSGAVVVSVDRIHHDSPDGSSARTPADLLSTLLSESVTQTTDEARARLHVMLLEQLVPDEARILAALSDGTAYPLVHVASRTAMGGVGTTMLENASTVGRSAGVVLTEHVPSYVAHLRLLGLVEVGPERGSLGDAYEMLLTEDVVRRARSGVASTRVLRRTLVLSPLGQQLWRACQHQLSVGELES
jgi:hypothetical protein